MGAPTSSIFSLLLLQYLENTKMIDILLQHKVIGHFCYKDDILIIYSIDTTNFYDVLNIFNNVMPSMNFTIEEENDNKINFLDIMILKENNFSFYIYRKPSSWLFCYRRATQMA
jgi:hypothetical protein